MLADSQNMVNDVIRPINFPFLASDNALLRYLTIQKIPNDRYRSFHVLVLKPVTSVRDFCEGAVAVGNRLHHRLRLRDAVSTGVVWVSP